MADRKAVVKNADMSEDMQQDAIDIATQALEKFNIEKDIAAFIKKEFDKKYNPTWHCIVGKNFLTVFDLKFTSFFQEEISVPILLTKQSTLSTFILDRLQYSSSSLVEMFHILGRAYTYSYIFD